MTARVIEVFARLFLFLILLCFLFISLCLEIAWWDALTTQNWVILLDSLLSHGQTSCSQTLYTAAIACFTLAGLMFALLIVRIEIGSETPEDVLHQIAVGLGIFSLYSLGSRDWWEAMERNDHGFTSVFDKERN